MLTLSPRTIPTPAMCPRVPWPNTSTAVNPAYTILKNNGPVAPNYRKLSFWNGPRFWRYFVVKWVHRDRFVNDTFFAISDSILETLDTKIICDALQHCCKLLYFQSFVIVRSVNPLSLRKKRREGWGLSMLKYVQRQPAGSPVFWPALLLSSTSSKPAVADFFTVGASPNLPATKNATVLATTICT